jgi:hypothetical protein
MGPAESEPVPRISGLLVGDLIAGTAGGLPLNVALGITLQVAKLLERAHGEGKLHGLLSPGAVWVTRAAEVWVEWRPEAHPVHRSMPPEIRHGETPTAASDIYALGALTYELLTGLSVSRAWAKAPLVQLQHVASAVYFNAQVPPQIDEVVAAALSRDPKERPTTVSAIGRLAELWVPNGSWEVSLASLLDDPFFEPAIRELPYSCELAGQVQPVATLPDSTLTDSTTQPWSTVDPLESQPTQPLRLAANGDVATQPVRKPLEAVEPTEPMKTIPAGRAHGHLPALRRAEEAGSQSGLMVFLACMLAAAASLSVCLIANELLRSNREADAGGIAASAAQSAGLAPMESHLAPIVEAPELLSDTAKPAKARFHKVKLRHRRG